MSETLDRRRAVHALGERAIQYYVDTGLCVFCNADDVEGHPHDEGCDVGVLSDVKVDTARRLEKARERGIVDAGLRGMS
jgi:hypothetical protein